MKRIILEERVHNLIENKEDAFKGGYADLDESDVSRIMDSMVYIIEKQNEAIKDLQKQMKELQKDYDNHMDRYIHTDY